MAQRAQTDAERYNTFSVASCARCSGERTVDFGVEEEEEVEEEVEEPEKEPACSREEIRGRDVSPR